MRLINTSDLLGPEWRFLEPYWPDSSVDWSFFTSHPKSTLERVVPRPDLARYRVARQAVKLARAETKPSMLVSHLPRMAAAVNVRRQRHCPEVPHVAFAFNFTDLPTGRDRRYLSRALQDIEFFVVFSTMERQLYSQHLEIPLERIEMLHWAMETPVVGADSLLSEQMSDYFCAVGGEARDYALLAQVMKDLPNLKLVIVARPYSVQGIDFSDNVTVLTNVPSPKTWRIVKDSCGMIIPLKTAATACGHITIVGTQLLGVPMVVTRSTGIVDYVDEDMAHVVTAAEAKELRLAIENLAQDPTGNLAMATQSKARVQARSSLARWVEYFQGLPGMN